MVKRAFFLCAIVMTAYPVTAATLVTWEGSGQVLASQAFFPGFPDEPLHQPAPPVGTPVSFTVSFDLDAINPTFNPAGTPGCVTVDVSGSLTLGDYTYGLNGDAFTNSRLPGTTCATVDRGRTEFGLHVAEQEEGTPWIFNNARGLLILSYRDQLVTDTFPDSPTTQAANLEWRPFPGATSWSFSSVVSLDAVDQMSPVPEPATLTLLAIGLAAAYRKRRAGSES